MNQGIGFEVMPFEIASGFEGEAYEGQLGHEGESEYERDDDEESETGSGAPVHRRAFRYVADFSGSAAECVRGLRRAGKTKAQALSLVNAHIGVAIKMLRKAAAALKRGSRTQATKDLFLKIFRVRPEFVPAWLKSTAAIKDRGDVVARRCTRVADLLASGRIKFYCAINATNCPDCAGVARAYACSSFGDDRVICLGDSFWDDMKTGRVSSNLATLMHEPFHIYFGLYVTEHRSNAGKFGGINCIVRFVFDANERGAPGRVTQACTDMAVRQELETSWA